MTDGSQNGVHRSEPSVLDWVKSLLRLRPIPIPPMEEPQARQAIAETEIIVDDFQEETQLVVQQWAMHFRPNLRKIRYPIALFFALLGQLTLEAKPSNVAMPLAFYLIGIIIAGWATWAGDFRFPTPADKVAKKEETGVRLAYLVAGALLCLLTFIATRMNRFTSFNLLFWAGALLLILGAFWEGDWPFKSFWQRIIQWFHSARLRVEIGPWQLIWIASIALVLFFRVSQLDQIPYEMWSDHKEKLLDVMDVLNGRHTIFFGRNTGREAMQFYLAAATAKHLGTGISFMTLKIGTVLAGLLTLPYLYFFAKEIGGRYLGLAAFLMAGIGYWPNVISRLGLRFPLYPLFAAPALFYLFRGLRLRQRNDLLLCGMAIGLALHGYSPARILPVAAALGVMIYLLHRVAKGGRSETIYGLFAMGVIAFVAFLPLFSATLGMPEQFFARMLSRMTAQELDIAGEPLRIFLGNLWNGLKMFGWDNGEMWVVSIPHRPALDWVTGAMFHLGVVIVLVRYLRQRRWQDLFLLISIPILMLPSTLSLAFPNENPALNRASGALVPAFTLAAIPLALLPQWARDIWDSKRAARGSLVFILLLGLLSASTNYHLVFKTFANQIRGSIWNTREIGMVIRNYASSIGKYDTAHVISPEAGHWVDTRLVAILAGVPEMDYETFVSDLETLPKAEGPRLFIFKPEDEQALAKLQELYPTGYLEWVEPEILGHGYMKYLVLAK